MTDEIDRRQNALWKVYEDNHAYVRHHETQRSTVAAAIFGATGIITGIILYDKRLSTADAPLGFLIILLGLFGVAFSQKLREKTSMHVLRADHLVIEAEKDFAGRSILDVTATADQEHNSRFPVLSKLRIGTFWTIMYVLLTLAGAMLFVLAVKGVGRAERSQAISAFVNEDDLRSPAPPASGSVAGPSAVSAPFPIRSAGHHP